MESPEIADLANFEPRNVEFGINPIRIEDNIKNVTLVGRGQ